MFTEMTWFIKVPPWSTSGLVQTAIAEKAHQKGQSRLGLMGSALVRRGGAHRRITCARHLLLRIGVAFVPNLIRRVPRVSG